ncbi:hypothetical protein SAMD00019534_106650 [Acytostelium subglobosum LB1]|uniref:hypothetical protein n=1 Tax=Acytostelium subglobosum LB1 TaxID=1410327 RepID=UPI000644EE4E|nr:hypothetical protein SAMD00019534_106650 [Acytostelium subglobosum LB1]GAM27489.1 hypothetical protein SAMD00019534_106650 [Acytostelium subglobosum LB1]|eukprot:XP_012749554.1 hypothetical protein SAMD00019534_106650 [Acytostelium subglobosum LB1]
MVIKQEESVVTNGWKLVPTQAASPADKDGHRPMEIDQQVTFNMGCLPIERHGHTTCLYKNILILFGGTPDGSSGLNDLFFLYLDSLQWVEVKTKGFAPMGRYRHSAIIIEDKMYVFGGYRSKCLNDLHVLDLKTMTWSEPQQKGDPPSARSSHSVCMVGKRMILFGGSGARYSNELFSLDTITMRWRKHDILGTPPSERWCHTMCSFGKKIFVFGGSNDKRKDNKVYILDTDTLEWSQPPTSGVCPSPRQLHTAVSIGEICIATCVAMCFHLLPGVTTHRKLTSNPTSIGTMRWESPKIESNVTPCCRQLHSAWVYNGKMYILGGYSKSKRMIDLHSFAPEQTVSSLRDLCVEKVIEDIGRYSELLRYLPEELLYAIYLRLVQSGKQIPTQLEKMIKESDWAEYALMNATTNNLGTIEETFQYN